MRKRHLTLPSLATVWPLLALAMAAPEVSAQALAVDISGTFRARTSAQAYSGTVEGTADVEIAQGSVRTTIGGTFGGAGLSGRWTAALSADGTRVEGRWFGPGRDLGGGADGTVVLALDPPTQSASGNCTGAVRGQTLVECTWTIRYVARAGAPVTFDLTGTFTGSADLPAGPVRLPSPIRNIPVSGTVQGTVVARALAGGTLTASLEGTISGQAGIPGLIQVGFGGVFLGTLSGGPGSYVLDGQWHDTIPGCVLNCGSPISPGPEQGFLGGDISFRLNTLGATLTADGGFNGVGLGEENPPLQARGTWQVTIRPR